MQYHNGLPVAGVPPPPPPPPINMAGPPTRRRRVGLNDLEVVDSAAQLRPCIPPNARPPLERIVRLPVGGLNRRAALTHHAATPFDLHAHLWLFRHAEPDRWYARPPAVELRRHCALEAAGLASPEMPGPGANNHNKAPRPACADVVRVCVGDVMGAANRARSCWCLPRGDGPADAQCGAGAACEVRNRRAIDAAFLTFYLVTEAPRLRPAAAVDEDLALEAYGPYPPPPPSGRPGSSGGRGEEKVYKLEMVGSREACVARAYHNAALNGWSTVFCCAVSGEVDIAEAARRPGLQGFERVEGLGALVVDAEDEEGRVKVFY